MNHGVLDEASTSSEVSRSHTPTSTPDTTYSWDHWIYNIRHHSRNDAMFCISKQAVIPYFATLSRTSREVSTNQLLLLS